jgi:hypothetical protein
MSLLAIFGGIAVLVWFYLTAKDKGEPRFNWAIIGFIGYWIAWGAVKLTVVAALSGLVAKGSIMAIIIYQIPALCAITAAFLIRKKLIADAAEK